MKLSFMLFRILIITFSLLSAINLFAQEGLVKSYYDNNKLKSEINYSNNIREGAAKFYYPNGNLKEELNYVNGAVDGVVKEYYESGKLKELYTIENGRREGPTSLYSQDGNYLKNIVYSAGILQRDQDTTSQAIASAGSDSLSQTNVVQKDSFDNSGYLTSAEIMPEPVGGMQTILNKLVYPQDAIKNKIEGTVKILADIDEFGEVNHAKVIKGIGYGCDESAKIAVFYTQFKPGLVKGKPVRVETVIPVEFKLK
ncbi:MAG: TonB family protein [Ignavibacteriaceae bacterium]